MRWAVIGGFAVGSAVVGWFAGSLISNLAKSILQSAIASSSGLINRIPTSVKQGFRLATEKTIRFSNTALQRMNNPGRRVPINILLNAIKYGSANRDPQGSSAIMYTIGMWKNGRSYRLEVLFDWASNRILHFLYK